MSSGSPGLETGEQSGLKRYTLKLNMLISESPDLLDTCEAINLIKYSCITQILKNS